MKPVPKKTKAHTKKFVPKTKQEKDEAFRLYDDLMNELAKREAFRTVLLEVLLDQVPKRKRPARKRL